MADQQRSAIYHFVHAVEFVGAAQTTCVRSTGEGVKSDLKRTII